MTTEHHQWRCVLPSTGADSMAEDATMAEPADDKATDGQILIEGTSSGLEYFLHPVRVSFAADKRALFMTDLRSLRRLCTVSALTSGCPRHPDA